MRRLKFLRVLDHINAHLDEPAMILKWIFYHLDEPTMILKWIFYHNGPTTIKCEDINESLGVPWSKL